MTPTHDHAAILTRLDDLANRVSVLEGQMPVAQFVDDDPDEIIRVLRDGNANLRGCLEVSEERLRQAESVIVSIRDGLSLSKQRAGAYCRKYGL